MEINIEGSECFYTLTKMEKGEAASGHQVKTIGKDAHLKCNMHNM